ncbi:MAG: lamin tail domain-containing protein [Gammaproteobacteria bacterium]|nr:lamin tail domain-containing protein [Gammaproteobacteria bacterium]
MIELRRTAAGSVFVGVLVSVAGLAQADLRFTEYVEGSSNNKALEIYNDTGAPVNLTGYEVRMYFNGGTTAGNTIALSGTVANDDVFVLANASADSAILVVADQTDANAWYNGDDAVELALSGGATIDVIGQIGVDPGSEWGAGLVSTQDNTLRRKETITTGDANGSDAFDPAIEWDGFDQNTFNGLGLYPGTMSTDPIPVAIPAIQGASHMSPVAGIPVITTGVVTAVNAFGFYMQDPAGDGDDDTSDGLFIFTSTPPTVAVGDDVEVTGSVTEFTPGGVGTGNLSITEIASPDSVVINSSGNALPAPVIIGSSGRLPPTEIIDNDNFALFDPAEDGIDFYETVEGMRVTVEDAVAVSPTNRFGEIFVLTNDGVHATNRNSRGGITQTESDFNPERIQVQLDNDLVPGFSADATVGDSLGNVTGVVSYGFGNFEVRITQAFTLTPGGLTPEITTATGSATQVTVATMNVLNLEANAADGDDDLGSGRFAALAAEIATNLAGPDILALQEIQDNDGSVDSGVVDASVSYQTLIDAITTAGGPAYDFVDIPPVNNQDGGQPGGNIRNGYLYQPARVDLITCARVLDPDLGDGDAFANSRKPLYCEFDFNGTRLHLINVHFTSKGGGSPIFGAIQPPINGGVERREDQAGVVNGYVDDLLANGDDKVIVLGDVNEWSYETPMEILTGSPAFVLNNLTQTLPAVEGYTFIFEGNSSPLEHILVSNSLTGTAYDIVHTDIEFPNPATDHDPSIMRFNFTVDNDGDGVNDNTDNCTLIANADQRDTDGDGIGNRCDPDVAAPNDCFVSFPDVAVYKTNFLLSGDLDTDNDGDGFTGFLDLAIAKAFFLAAPGPSATGCN